MLDVRLRPLPLHTSFAFSNALDKRFLIFEQVRWCLVSAVSCWNVRPHGQKYSLDEVDAMNWELRLLGKCTCDQLI